MTDINLTNTMDYMQLHLETNITEAQEAITKFTNSIKGCDTLIEEFTSTDPLTAQIYWGWKIFHQEKLDYFQQRMEDLQVRLSKRENKQ